MIRSKFAFFELIGAADFLTGPSPKFSVSAFLAHGSSLQIGSPQRLITLPFASITTGQSGGGGSSLDGNSMPQERREATR